MEPKALAPAKINPTKLLGGSSFAIKKISVSNNIRPQKGDFQKKKQNLKQKKNNQEQKKLKFLGFPNWDF
jgi:hypothetical protein